MRKGYAWLLVAVCAAAALAVVSCSGGGGDNSSCATPITLTPGTWCITITATQNNCGTPLDSTPYTATFTQDGTNLSATTSQGTTFAGRICGNEATMSGTNNPSVKTDIHINFPTVDSATGTTYWYPATCSGVDTFSAVSGTCP